MCTFPRPSRHVCGGPHGRPTLLQPRSAPARMNCSSSRFVCERTISVARSPGAYETFVNTAVSAGGDHSLAGAAAPADTTSAATARHEAVVTQPRSGRGMR